MEKEEEKIGRETYGLLVLCTLSESSPFRIDVQLRGWSTFPLRSLLQV
jgi:hypothetical protein